MNTCKTCKHWGDDDRRLHRCERMWRGYATPLEEVPDNGAIVEDDEGWAMLTGPDFGCVLHEAKESQ